MKFMLVFVVALVPQLGLGAKAPCTVAVASNFSVTAKQLLAQFNNRPGNENNPPLRQSSASTGKLYNQIIYGAPYCAFLAADTLRPKQLLEKKLAQANSDFIYASGQLALWAKTAPPRFADLNTAKKIALANPKLAPYGLAAQQTLQQLGLLHKLKTRLVYGENVNQALQFTASQNAQIGLVALAQVLALPAGKKGHWVAVPQTLHQPLKQTAVLLNAGINNKQAISFLAYLRSSQAREIITTAGYIVQPLKD